MPPFRRHLSKGTKGHRAKSQRKGFQASRLNDSDEVPPDVDPVETQGLDEVKDLGVSEEDEDEANVTINSNPYSALLQSFNSSSGASKPLRKKRKISVGLSSVAKAPPNRVEQLPVQEADIEIDRPDDAGENAEQEEEEQDVNSADADEDSKSPL